MKKTYIVQLFTGQGTIAKEIKAVNVVEAMRAFVVLMGYRRGETISVTER